MQKKLTTILVVDDDHVIVRLLEKRLRVDGYEVITAYDGTSALEKARAELPFAIILDVILPDINGKEVARRLHADSTTKDIPIVFLTITIKRKDDRGDRRITVDGVSYPAMAKPMHTPKLLSMLRKEVNKRIHKNI